MRTKTLLLTASIMAAGLGASMAQVYSVNAVGYVNLPVVAGYNLIANPLNGSNNVISTILPSAPDQATIFIWNKAAQLFLQSDTYQNFPPPDNGWYDGDGNPSTKSIPPGSAFYFVSPVATTLTFVGEVPQGNLTNGIVANYGFYSSIVPQSASLASMSFPVVDQMALFYFNPATQRYNQSIVYQDFPPPDNGWYDGDGNPVVPALTVGQGCLIFNPSTLQNWTRTFNVNN
jgi:hypothetical protein